MQHTDKKTVYLRKIIGEVLNEIRMNKNISCNKIENEFDLARGTLYRIENSKIDTKIITIWRICEALDVKLSDVVKLIENKVGKDFKLTDI